MDLDELRRRFIPAIEGILDECRISDEYVDTEKFQVMIATVWGNAVLDPERSGLLEDELPELHDFLNEEIERVLGEGATVTGCYEYIVSKPGQDSLVRQQVSQRHKEFLFYFARLILQREVTLKP